MCRKVWNVHIISENDPEAKPMKWMRLDDAELTICCSDICVVDLNKFTFELDTFDDESSGRDLYKQLKRISSDFIFSPSHSIALSLSAYR